MNTADGGENPAEKREMKKNGGFYFYFYAFV